MYNYTHNLHLYHQDLHGGMRRIGKMARAFPGGSVVKNPPATAGNMGSIPGSGKKSTCHRAAKPVSHDY